jgi:hypothetical protein
MYGRGTLPLPTLTGTYVRRMKTTHKGTQRERRNKKIAGVRSRIRHERIACEQMQCSDFDQLTCCLMMAL